MSAKTSSDSALFSTNATPEATREVGLTFSSDSDPVIYRKRTDTGFRYVDSSGEKVYDEKTVDRIKALVIPPAWEEVWICARASGHIQVTGRDQKGRKQYRYHTKWRTHREDGKFGRLAEFGAALPKIREQVEIDLHRHNLPREKVLAAVIALLERTHIRVGNEEYARTNKSFGLTTLRDRHVSIGSSSVKFRFKGKSGKEHDVTVQDRRLAKVIKRCQDLPGQRLFVYEDDGNIRQVGSSEVNAYLREITGADYSAKDFRTWSGTVIAASVLRHFPVPESESVAKRDMVAAADAVSDLLGNTRAVARTSYIHPAVFDSYQNGSLQKLEPEKLPDVEPSGLDADERIALAVLRKKR